MKRRLLALILSIAMIGSIFAGYTVSADVFDGGNLVKNGTFADGINNWNVSNIAELSTEGIDDDAALKIVGGSAWASVQSDSVEIETNTDYRLTMYKKGTGSVTLSAEGFDGIGVSWGAEWEKVNYYFNSGDKTSTKINIFETSGNTMELYIDRISLTKVSDAADDFEVAKYLGENLLTNGDMEEVNEEGKPLYWGVNPAWNSNSAGSLDGRGLGVNGSNALRIDENIGYDAQQGVSNFADYIGKTLRFSCKVKFYTKGEGFEQWGSISKETLTINTPSGFTSFNWFAFSENEWSEMVFYIDVTEGMGGTVYLKTAPSHVMLIDDVELCEVIDKPVATTEPTEPPVESTEEPVEEPTEPPVEPTEEPVEESTEEPVAPTEEPTPEPTPVPDVDLIKNGDFSRGATFWNVSTIGQYEVVDEACGSENVFKMVGGTGGKLYQVVSVVPGASYTFKYGMQCTEGLPVVGVYNYDPVTGTLGNRSLCDNNWNAAGNINHREQKFENSSTRRSAFLSAEGEYVAVVFPSTNVDFYVDDVQLIGPAPAEDKKAEQMYANMLVDSEWKYEKEAGVSIDENDVIKMSKTYDFFTDTWTECSSYVYKWAPVVPGRQYVACGYKQGNVSALWNMELWTVDENGNLKDYISGNNWGSQNTFTAYVLGAGGKVDNKEGAYTVPEGVYGLALLGRPIGGSYEESITTEATYKNFGLYDVTESFAFDANDIPVGTGATVDGKNITVVVPGAEATLDLAGSDGSKAEYFADADCGDAISATLTGLDTEDKVVYAKIYSYLNARYRVYTVTVKSEVKMFNDAKAQAKADLETYKDFADYRKAQQVELQAKIDAGKASIEAATNQDELDVAIAAAKADLDKVLTDDQVYGTLLAYDSFSGEAGAALTAREGDLNITGDIQNAPEEGYVLADANPLTYPGLVTKGNYGIGGHAWVTGAFKLNTSAAEFAPYISEDYWGKVGKTGTTLWASMLMRNDSNDGWAMIVGSLGWHHTDGIKFGKTGLSNDYISMHVGDNHENTTITAISDVEISKDPVFYVFKYEFLSATSTKISCWINPKLGKEPTGEPDMQLTTEDFRGIGTIRWYPGSGNNNGSIDEIRVATGYEAVAPLADGTELYAEDFEGDTSAWKVLNGNGVDLNEDTKDVDGQQQPKEETSWGIVEDFNNPNNKALKISDTTWGVFRTEAFVKDLNIDSDYTMVLRVAGDAGWLGLTHDGHWNPSAMIASVDENKTPTPAYTGISNKWKTYAVKFTGMEIVKFAGQVQAAWGVMDGNLYIDDIKIYSGDIVEDMKGDIAEFEQAKTDAAAGLDSYKVADEYRDEQKTELADAIAAGKKAIENATTQEALEKAVEDAKAAMDAIKTDAVLTAEELQKAKDDAKAELDNYKNADDYRDAEKTILAEAITAGKTAIDACTVIGDVATALADAKAAMDAIKTDAELTAEELAAAKDTAKAELDSYKNADDYRDAEKEALAKAIADAKEAIDAATDVDGVNAAVATAKSAMDELKTDAEYKAEEEANQTPAPTPGTEGTPGTTAPTVSEAPTTTPTATPSAPVAKKVKKVKLAKKSVKIKKGKKFTIKVKLTPKKLTKKAKRVKWSINKKGRKVVKFVKKAKKLNGKLKVKVKALKKGKAKITCKAPSGKKAVCKIIVK